MQFHADYPVFVAGCFYDREGRIKARVDNDKHVVREAFGGKIVGYIRDSKLYDVGLNYVGCFRDGVLYSSGGSIMGYCNSWKYNEAEEKNGFSSTSLIGWVCVVAGFIYLIFRIFQIFF